MVKLKVKLLSGIDKIKGLSGAKKAYPVFFQTRFGIHTFGLKFPIDVLILDQDDMVVKLAENLKSNRIFIWNPLFDKCIELPAGEIKKRKISKKSKIGLILRKTLSRRKNFIYPQIGNVALFYHLTQRFPKTF